LNYAATESNDYQAGGSQERTRLIDPVGMWEPRQRGSFLSDFPIEDVMMFAHSGG
jgi:hypothetical protein